MFKQFYSVTLTPFLLIILQMLHAYFLQKQGAILNTLYRVERQVLCSTPAIHLSF